MNTTTAVEQMTLVEAEAKPAALPAVQQAGAVANYEAASLIQVIASAARDPNVDIEKMERLWAMHDSMKNRANEEAFNAAMNKAQSEMGRVSTDATNPQTRSDYATYGKLDAAVRPIYTRHGFSISFNEGEGAPDGFVRILAYVSHSAGHTRTYKADLPNDGKGAKGGDVMTKTHATGSAHSYGRRYLLKDIFNIAIGEEDNDGNGDGDDGGGGQERGYTSAQTLQKTLVDSGFQVALGGEAELDKWWGKLTPKQRNEIGREFFSMKKRARQADNGGAR